MAEEAEKAEGALSIKDDPISNAFQKILENPEIINTVAAAIGMPSPTNAAAAEKIDEAHKAPDNEAMATLAPLLSSISQKSPSSKISSNQACLLRALKPYVNPNRCEAIDYIIKISEISQLLKKIN